MRRKSRRRRSSSSAPFARRVKRSGRRRSGGRSFGRGFLSLPAGAVPAVVGTVAGVVASNQIAPRIGAKYPSLGGNGAQLALKIGMGLVGAAVLRRYSTVGALAFLAGSAAEPLAALVRGSLARALAPAAPGAGVNGWIDAPDAASLNGYINPPRRVVPNVGMAGFGAAGLGSLHESGVV